MATFRQLLRRVRRNPFRRFGPNVSAQRLNEEIRDMWANRNGGWIICDGKNKAYEFTEPVTLLPGVRLEAVGYPMLYQAARTRIQPQFAGPAFVIDDGKTVGKRQAWGGSELVNWQVEATRPGQTGLLQTGGNRTRVTNFLSAYGRVPLEHFVIVDQGRVHDGQYSIYDNASCTRAHYPLTITRNIPDTRFLSCMFYGDRTHGGIGVNLAKAVNNVKLLYCDVQFNWLGFDINGNATTVTSGSWENRHGAEPYATAAVRLGPTSLDTTFRDVDFANFDTLINRRVFDIDERARRFTFQHLTGHVRPAHVPDGLQDHFVWAAP